MDIEDFTANMIRCTNGTCGTNNRTVNLKVLSSCEVNMTLEDGSDIWLTMFSEVIQKVVGDIKSAADLDNALMGLKNITVVLEMEKMVVNDIIVNKEVNEKEKNPSTSKNGKEQNATFGVRKNDKKDEEKKDKEEHITMSTKEGNDEEKENKKKKQSNKTRTKNPNTSKNAEEQHATLGVQKNDKKDEEKKDEEHITVSTEEESDEENEKNPITSKHVEEQHATPDDKCNQS